MSKNEPIRNKKMLNDQAANWVIRIDDGLNSEEKIEFEAWKKTVPNADELLKRHQAVWFNSDALLSLDEDDFLEDDLENAPLLLKKKSIHLYQWFGGLAAVFIVGFVWLQFSGSRVLEESEKIFLSAEKVAETYSMNDGSEVDLYPNTEIHFHYSERSRDFWIDRGEVYFIVAKDEGRPFRVHAGDRVVEAVGTEFNVKQGDDMLEVLVTEGIVKVMPALDATSAIAKVVDLFSRHNETMVRVNHKVIVRYDRSKQKDSSDLHAVNDDEIEESLKWKPLTLMFESVTLREAVNEFNKHNIKQIVILNKDFEKRKIVATFKSNKVEAFARMLETTLDANVLIEDDCIYIK